MRSRRNKIVGTLALCILSLSSWAQQFTITSDQKSASCGNQHVTFEAGFIEVGTTYSFNSGELPSQWTSSPYDLGQACSGAFADTPDQSDYFWATINDPNGQRFVATSDLNVSIGGQITFSMRFGRDDPSSGCENPDEPSEGVYLQYSTDGGSQWSTIKYWVPTQIGTLTPEGIDLYSWTQFEVSIPEEAKSNSTRFRWFQPSNSGSSYDNWGMDDISVYVLKEAQTYQWDMGDGQVYEDAYLKADFESDGLKTIHCTVQDHEGTSYTSSLSYEVIVDREAPQAVAKNHFLILDENGETSLIADYMDGGSSDNCSELNLAVDRTSFSCADLGDQTITLTVSDKAGNTATATATLSIYDFTAPTVLTKDTTIQLNSEGIASIRAEQINGGSRDACSERLSLELSKSEFGVEDLGENIVTLYATDESGNQASARAKIIVEDVQGPQAYTVSFDEKVVKLENQLTQSFTMSGAEIGSTYAYTIRNIAGGTVVSGHGKVIAALQQVANIDLTSLDDGELLLSLTLTDKVGNSGEAANDEIYKDCSRPSVTISAAAEEIVSEAFVVNIDFNEVVSDFTVEDLNLLNAQVTELQLISAQQYSLRVMPLAEGLVSLSVKEGVVIDAAENINLPSEQWTIYYDATPPTSYDFAEQPEPVNIENVHKYQFALKGLETGAQLYYAFRNAAGKIILEDSMEVVASDMLIEGVNLIHLADGKLNLSFYLKDEAANQGEVVQADILKTTVVDILQVETLNSVEVPFASRKEALELPKKVSVDCSDGSQKSLKVAWSQESINTEQPGRQLIEGELELDDLTNSKNIKAQLALVVHPNLPPSQLKFSASSFSPSLASAEAIGHFSTEDVDDEEHVYQLLEESGGNDNQYFIIQGDALYLNSSQRLAGQEQFTIQVQSTDAYANTIQAEFRLSKTALEPNGPIQFVNTFSPNGDGINETWLVPDLRYFEDVLIEVYDRAGRRVFQTTDPEQGWDGTYNGSIQKGNYYYSITVHDIQLSKRGVLSVIK